ncbi:hypothetical protein DERP_007014 [Dermatophagoides pteronyssinus]|uniref:Uncharacterized protein n=1 Tax=Dermatophagoides pteronyssinus TaxID=6956 RepID=A0ABQ8JTZ9_DERPT|nr:hypothetical protein DERP_007014 [Dermatophagoides pteronyssinus]
MNLGPAFILSQINASTLFLQLTYSLPIWETRMTITTTKNFLVEWILFQFQIVINQSINQ